MSATSEPTSARLHPRTLPRPLRETFGPWLEDEGPRLGAALAFYRVLSLAPLLLIAIAVAALFFGEEAARGHLVEQLRGLIGRQGGAAIETMLAHVRRPVSGMV